MQYLCYMFLLLLTLPLDLPAETATVERNSEWYHEHYSFMTLRGTPLSEAARSNACP